MHRYWRSVLVVAAVVVIGATAATAQGLTIRIFGGSGLFDSGVFQHKMQAAYMASPYYVAGDTLTFTSVGSGRALTSGEQGFADVVIANSPKLEQEFLAGQDIITPPPPVLNNFGIWVAGSTGSTTGLNDGGDSTFKLSFGQVAAAAGETVANRTAEQSTDPVPGIFQAGVYTGAGADNPVTCPATALGEQLMFTEWRNAGAGNAYNCNSYGDASLLAPCDADVGLVTGASYQWNAELGCSSAPSVLTERLNWGSGIDYVGGELAGTSGFSDGSATNVFYDPSHSWVTWTGIDRGSPVLATPVACRPTSVGWTDQAPDASAANFAIAHPANASGTSC
jgi:hypothetical protein